MPLTKLHIPLGIWAYQRRAAVGVPQRTLTVIGPESSEHPQMRLRELFGGETISGGQIAVEREPSQSQAAPMGPEFDDLGSCVTRLVNVLAKGTEEVVEPHDLIPMDYAVLRLFLHRQQWTLTELAVMLPIKTSRASRVVAKLVDRGLMRRRRPRSDRRVVFLTLTDEGKSLTLDVYRRIEAYETSLLQGVSDQEMSALLSSTSKILANYAQLTADEGDAARTLRAVALSR